MSELGLRPAQHPHRSALQQSIKGAEALGQARYGSKLNIQWLLTMRKSMEGKWCVRSHSAHPMSELNTRAPLDRGSSRKSRLKKEWLGVTAQLQPVSLRRDTWFVPRWRAAGLRGVEWLRLLAGTVPNRQKKGRLSFLPLRLFLWRQEVACCEKRWAFAPSCPNWTITLLVRNLNLWLPS